MENLSLILFSPLLTMFIFVVLWAYLFIYSYHHKFTAPWGFGIIIIGLLFSGFGYAFHDNHTTVFSINLMFVICLIGLLWNINNIQKQFYFVNIRKFFFFIGIGLTSGLFFGFLAMITEGTKYLQVSNQYTSLALVLSSIQVSLAEEFLFRGYLLGYMKNYRFNQTFAVVLQSVLFAMLHVPRYPNDLLAIAIVFFSGVVSGYLTWKSNNLIPSFVLHIVSNLIAVIWWLTTAAR